MSETKSQQEPKTVTEQQAAAKRVDPVFRHADGASYGTELRRASPERRYVLVNPNNQEMGVEFYAELGYAIEKYREGGPEFYAAKTGKPGDTMVWRGHVLMSISAVDFARLRAKGGAGAGKGAEYWTRLEQALLVRGQQKQDLLRGIAGRQYMSVVNQSKDLGFEPG